MATPCGILTPGSGSPTICDDSKPRLAVIFGRLGPNFRETQVQSPRQDSDSKNLPQPVQVLLPALAVMHARSSNPTLSRDRNGLFETCKSASFFEVTRLLDQSWSTLGICWTA